ncbi:hypothetical protein FACS1894120_4450 [Clostridia bacterium]|nr:hypothetical protein FACS1894120_4450 [Clostridia bacterium]
MQTRKKSFNLRKLVRLARTGGTGRAAGAGDLLHLPLAAESESAGAGVAISTAVRVQANKGYKRYERRKSRERRYYNSRLAVLVSLCAVSVWQWGISVVLLIIAGLLSAVLTDYICCRISGKVYSRRDKSTLCAGLCIGLMLPWSVSPWLAVFGAALSICVKHIFGGRRAYIFCPTAVAVCFLIICYPASMLLYTPPPADAPSVSVISALTETAGAGSANAVTGAANTAAAAAGTPAVSANTTGTAAVTADTVAAPKTTIDYLTGQFVGASGTVHLFVILVCGVVMLCGRAISCCAVFAALLTSLVCTGLAGVFGAAVPFATRYLVGGEIGAPLAAYAGAGGGYFLFAVLFLLSDPQILPRSRVGKIYYGMYAGLFEAVFYYFGKTSGAILFALLIADIFALRCDLYAAYTRKFAGRVYLLLHSRVHSFEQVREVSAIVDTDATVIAEGMPAPTTAPVMLTSEMKQGTTPDITRELDITSLRYNMPPIEGKITKVTRNKYIFAHFMSKNVNALRRLLRHKRKPTGSANPANHMSVILPYMREGAYAVKSGIIKALGIKPRLTPLELAANEMLKTETPRENAKPAEQDKKAAEQAEPAEPDKKAAEQREEQIKQKSPGLPAKVAGVLKSAKEKITESRNKFQKHHNLKDKKDKQDKETKENNAAEKSPRKNLKNTVRVTRKLRVRRPKSKDRTKSRGRKKK